MNFKGENFGSERLLNNDFFQAVNDVGAENFGGQEPIDDIAIGGKENPVNEVENFNGSAGQKIVGDITRYLRENFPPEAVTGVSSLIFAVCYFNQALANKGVESIAPAATGLAFTASAAVNFVKALINREDESSQDIVLPAADIQTMGLD